MTVEEQLPELPDRQRIAYMSYLADLQSVRVNSFRAVLFNATSTISDTTSQNLDHKFKTTKNLLYVITHVSAIERTTAPTRIELCVVRGGREYLVTATDPGTADISVDFAGQIIVAPGDSLRAKFVGGTSADEISMDIHGYTVEG